MPSAGLAKALGVGNVKMIGFHFAILRDCRIVIPLSCTHDKLYPGSATPRRLSRSLTCCLPCLTAHLLHLKLLLYDYAVLRNFKIATPLSCTNDKHHPGSTTPRWLPRRLIWCVPSHKAPAASHVSRLATPVVDVMYIDALRGGVAPKSNASVCTVCFILEAPGLGKCRTGHDFFT